MEKQKIEIVRRVLEREMYFIQWCGNYTINTFLLLVWNDKENLPDKAFTLRNFGDPDKRFECIEDGTEAGMAAKYCLNHGSHKVCSMFGRDFDKTINAEIHLQNQLNHKTVGSTL